MKHLSGAGGALLLLLMPLRRSATLPPLPKPDPVALSAAEQLVDQLPLDGVDTRILEAHNAKNALAWLQRTNPNAYKDVELTRLFAAKVASMTEASVPTCLPEARKELAIWFSWRLAPDDAQNISTFLATKAGRALAPEIVMSPYVKTLKTCTSRLISKNFQETLNAAIISNNIRREINNSVVPEKK